MSNRFKKSNITSYKQNFMNKRYKTKPKPLNIEELSVQNPIDEILNTDETYKSRESHSQNGVRKKKFET